MSEHEQKLVLTKLDFDTWYRDWQTHNKNSYLDSRELMHEAWLASESNNIASQADTPIRFVLRQLIDNYDIFRMTGQEESLVSHAVEIVSGTVIRDSDGIWGYHSSFYQELLEQLEALEQKALSTGFDANKLNAYLDDVRPMMVAKMQLKIDMESEAPKGAKFRFG